MSNDLAVKKSQLTNSIKQMSDYLKGKIDSNTNELNAKVNETEFENYINRKKYTKICE